MASGRLKFSPDGIAQGSYSDFRNNLALMFEPIEGSARDNAPSHHVYASAPGGKLTLCGAAWKKTVQAEHKRGQIFYSFTVDDPNMAQPLNLTAFQVTDAQNRPVEGEFEVVWKRQRAEAA